ncbi:MAG: hypothetical protein SFY80_07300 [Verrucomicrobiota bacterium]|nr:hypothetical protein [Verrucomicrobiota bacterium]
MNKTITTLVTITFLTLGAVLSLGSLAKTPVLDPSSRLPMNQTSCITGLSPAEAEAACRVNSVMVQQGFTH